MTRLDELEALLETDREEAALRLLAMAPKLIAVVRCAQDLDGHTELCETMQPYRGCTCGYGNLSAALADLEKP